jgi:hypothetical protein
MRDRTYFVDTTRSCCDCGKSYAWTAGEAAYYDSKGLTPPKRCPACRELRRRTINRPEVDR